MEKYLYSMLNESSGALGTEEIILRILVSVALGAVIYLSYFLTHSGSIYSRKFNITLLTLTVLTTMVMTVIGNNIALSLGMVGALSIVRFRTSIKDSRDTVYIFWDGKSSGTAYVIKECRKQNKPYRIFIPDENTFKEITL